ncbi:unnamed protein product [Mytilus coruscus]|uniref:WSC domain-containing protein n=1 Tax=Mytilus coruscus TaxID=42192 RepID=A0A6J8BRR7_MYTCO|nr:unnamed protein product [Mytilus coruscus]
MVKFILRVYCLFVFAREVFPIEQNSTVTVCENEPVKLSCTNNSNVKITSVTYGPKIEASSTSLLNDDNSTKHQIENVCNDRHSCLVNESSINFTQYQTLIPRTIDVSYRCEYVYVGCYHDDWDRAFDFQHGNPHKRMSTKICYNFCSRKPQFSFFATEKVNIQWVAYGCSMGCKNNPKDICGGEWHLSVYKMNTDHQAIKTTSEKLGGLCGNNAKAKDILLNMHNGNGICSFTTSQKINRITTLTEDNYNGKDYCSLLKARTGNGVDNPYYKPNYAILNFSCIANIASSIQDDVQSNDQTIQTSIIIGTLGGVLTIVMIALLLLALRNRKQHTAKQHSNDKLSENNRSVPKVDDDCHLYANASNEKYNPHNTGLSNAENVLYLNYVDNSAIFSRTTDSSSANINTYENQKQADNIKPKQPQSDHDTSVYCNYDKSHSNQSAHISTRNREIADNNAVQKEDEYDHTDRSVWNNDNVYNETKDGVYDVGSHDTRLESRSEDTYDHFFGNTTEDDYDISHIKRHNNLY